MDRRLNISSNRRRANRPLSFRFLLLVALVPAFLIGAEARAGDAQPTQPTITPITAPATDYRIGLFDKLTVTVFGVKELEADNIQVDAAGQIQMPLIGMLQAKGRTSRELADEIARRLDDKYLRDAQVSVVISESANQKITVEGAVTNPGVFDIPGRMSLLQAVAMAKGPTNRANLKTVAVYRDIAGKRERLVFNCEAIRAGKVDDPELLGNDVVVVSESGALAAFREAVGDVGAFSIFSVFRPF